MGTDYYFDVGNSRAKFWCCRDGSVLARAVVTHGGDAAKAVAMLPPAFDRVPEHLRGAAVLADASQAAFAAACRERWGLVPSLAASSLHRAGVTNAYGDKSGSLGVDRWLALLAVAGSGQDVCVVDAGTAVTLDVLRADGQHLGGYILPGIAMMADSLVHGTGRVRFAIRAAGDSLGLGRDTAEAVTHGALAALVALIERVGGEDGRRLVLTGGDAARLSAHLSCPHVVEVDLLLQGLQRYFTDAGIN